MSDIQRWDQDTQDHAARKALDESDVNAFVLAEQVWASHRIVSRPRPRFDHDFFTADTGRQGERVVFESHPMAASTVPERALHKGNRGQQ